MLTPNWFPKPLQMRFPKPFQYCVQVHYFQLYNLKGSVAHERVHWRIGHDCSCFLWRWTKLTFGLKNVVYEHTHSAVCVRFSQIVIFFQLMPTLDDKIPAKTMMIKMWKKSNVATLFIESHRVCSGVKLRSMQANSS